MSETTKKAPARFSPGTIVATPGALAALEATAESAFPYLNRHLRGDWGIVSKADGRLNDRATHEDTRVLSAYTLKDGTKIWIITEADRSSTCILLPEEY
jgi:hypothetical protein